MKKGFANSSRVTATTGAGGGVGEAVAPAVDAKQLLPRFMLIAQSTPSRCRAFLAEGSWWASGDAGLEAAIR